MLTHAQQRVVRALRDDPEGYVWHSYWRSGRYAHVAVRHGNNFQILYKTLDLLVDLGVLIETDFDKEDCIYVLSGEWR